MCYDSHSAYRWVLPWRNAKALRVGYQLVPPKTDAIRTSMTPPVFFIFCVLKGFLTYLITSSTGTWGNGSKITCNGNLLFSVTSTDQLGIRYALRVRLYLWAEVGQKILFWKLGAGCNFGSNGPIYAFNFIFLYTVFFCTRFFVRFFLFCRNFFYTFSIYSFICLFDWQCWAIREYHLELQ